MDLGSPLFHRYPPFLYLQLISFEADSAKAHAHWDKIKRDKAYNNIVGKTPLADSYITKFMECPEFLRYQVW